MQDIRQLARGDVGHARFRRQGRRGNSVDCMSVAMRTGLPYNLALVMNRYIPALNRAWLTPIYDWTMRNLFREDAFKRALLDEAGLRSGDQVLDIGCGTGTLTIALARACSGGRVVGLDGDARVLKRASAKAAAQGVTVSFQHGLSYALPYLESTFDRVTSSMMLHHLERDDKVRTFREVFRVLKSGGRLDVADFGPPDGTYSRVISRALTIRLERARENIGGELPAMIESAGFVAIAEGARFGTLLGTIRLLHASKSPTA